MNKKTILGLLTGAAIVAATTGSYAAWDSLSDTKTLTVKLGKPVTVTLSEIPVLDKTSDTDLHGDNFPSYTTTLTVKGENAGDKDVEWQFTPTVNNNVLDVTISPQAGGSTKPNGNDQTFDVTVTANDSTKAAITEAGIDVSIKAELVKTTVE